MRIRNGQQWKDGGQVSNTPNFTGQTAIPQLTMPTTQVAGDGGGLQEKLMSVLQGAKKSPYLNQVRQNLTHIQPEKEKVQKYGFGK